MIEIEVYAAGLRKEDNILRLSHALDEFPTLRYQVDRNHDLVYFEMSEAVITLDRIRKIFSSLGLEGRFVGEIPEALEDASKTRRIE